ncbi:Tab2/Atab2 family RNA-binding protein [Moorena producens JHB]|uniref:Tab2/Atab2 family RNA-binding protein n=1 Tax=Moorena producens (strain JHB) TaxID=1454205 RepID=A0A1D9FT85_MOOP1|nr:Tab2/Atab2 family RNA-binding protein [Moorena producens]AOY78598.1 Tab2/Atab2 family RNA-binding protein [Moorena producens JHB]
METIWELDFYSRPILDDNQKKLWEVLICESPLDINLSPETLFQYASWCPNQQVNSIWLGQALADAIAKAQQPPSKIRFFRRQMNNMITKACNELNIPAQPSRRTYALERWLKQRIEDFYPNQAGYDPAAAASSFVRYQSPIPKPLPDALQGQKWAVVSLQAAAFEEMNEWEIDFGEAFPVSIMDIAPETPIPGLIIYSQRAKPLAAWMSGLELSFVRLDTTDDRPKLLLETGANDSWILANLTKSQILAEAKSFEEAKQKANFVHFLAVQSSPTSERFAGFWLCREL